ncbi:DUF4376 domain-containing protein [Chitinimonas naiadis]
MSYAVIQAGAIAQEFVQIPDAFANVSGFPGLSESDRAKFGFVPVIETKPPLGPFQYYSGHADVITAVSVLRTWSVGTPPLADIQAQLRQKVAEYRFNLETGGILVNGATIKTDRESQATLACAKVYADIDPAATVSWKADGGVWVSLTQAQVTAIAKSVGAFVQACFSAEKAKCDAITAFKTVADAAAFTVASGWPASQ